MQERNAGLSLERERRPGNPGADLDGPFAGMVKPPSLKNRFSGLRRANVAVASGCIGIHAVKIYQVRIAAVYRVVLLPFLPICCRDRTPNAFWRCVQCDVILNGADFQKELLIVTRRHYFK